MLGTNSIAVVLYLHPNLAHVHCLRYALWTCVGMESHAISWTVAALLNPLKFVQRFRAMKVLHSLTRSVASAKSIRCALWICAGMAVHGVSMIAVAL